MHNLPSRDEKIRTFVRALVDTGSLDRAAELAGMARGRAMALLENPAVAVAVQRRLAAKLTAVAPAALDVLTGLMADPAVPAAVRRMAANDLLTRCNVITLHKNGPSEGVADMPPSALRALIGRLESELADRAEPVATLDLAPVSSDNAPGSVRDPANPLNILD